MVPASISDQWHKCLTGVEDAARDPADQWHKCLIGGRTLYDSHAASCRRLRLASILGNFTRERDLSPRMGPNALKGVGTDHNAHLARILANRMLCFRRSLTDSHSLRGRHNIKETAASTFLRKAGGGNSTILNTGGFAHQKCLNHALRL